MNITLIGRGLTSGGAERVLVELAKLFHNIGHTVTILTIENSENDFYSIPDGIVRKHLQETKENFFSRNKITKFFLRIHNLEKAFYNCSTKKPDIIISFLHQINIISILAVKKKIPIIITEHSNPKLDELPIYWKILRRLSYRYASELVVVSYDLKKMFSWCKNTTVIHNPIPDMDEYKIAFQRKENTFVTMGRLAKVKNQQAIIEAFSKVNGWKLKLIGEGDKQSQLKQLVLELGERDRISFTGALDPPFPELAKCKVFLLTSLYEGFPNAVLEAMALGIPVISYDCDTGPREIITDGKDGFLIPMHNIDMLVEKMKLLMKDKNLLQEMSKNAVESSKKYEGSLIIKEWESLFKRVLNEKR